MVTTDIPLVPRLPRPTSHTTPSIVTWPQGRVAAPHWPTSTNGRPQVYTYSQVLHEVKRIAAALRGLGVGRGDRITIYMPTTPRRFC